MYPSIYDHFSNNGGGSGFVKVNFNNYNNPIYITAGSKYKFVEATEQTANNSFILNYGYAVSGYVKYKKGNIMF